jgi:hypothetical protein
MSLSSGDSRRTLPVPARAPAPPSQPAPTPGPGAVASPDLARIKYGACLIGGAFVLLGIVFGVAVSRFTAAADVTAVVGSVATVVGTIVGAFFGIQVGSSGKEAVEAGRAKAESTARKALAKLEPHEAADLIGSL